MQDTTECMPLPLSSQHLHAKIGHNHFACSLDNLWLYINCLWSAVTQGMNSFDHYKDPVTGKEGKINVSVTVGPYRGHKLVRPKVPNASSYSKLKHSI